MDKEKYLLLRDVARKGYGHIERMHRFYMGMCTDADSRQQSPRFIDAAETRDVLALMLYAIETERKNVQASTEKQPIQIAQYKSGDREDH